MAVGREVFEVTTSWLLANSYEATAAVDVIVSGTSSGPLDADDVKYLITDDDTPPTDEVRNGHPIKRGEVVPMQLAIGEFVWFAKVSAPNRLREVTLTWAT